MERGLCRAGYQSLGGGCLMPEPMPQVMSEVPETVLLAGFGEANQAVARSLLARGHEVTVFDDRPSAAARSIAETLALELLEAPGENRLKDMVRSSALLMPTPGMPERHPVMALAAAQGVVTASELDLARIWDSRPIAAITGTSGKTTVTETVAAALNASGINAVPAGNTGMPLVTAIDCPDVEVFVVEASSFRLGHSQRFKPSAGCWLNFAPDHLDVHRDMGSYEAAKAKLWRDIDDSATVVANPDDPAVMRYVPEDIPVWTFSEEASADWHVRNGELASPLGSVLPVGDLNRRRPHDIANALAAAATATAVGATLEGVREALSDYEPGHHRLERVAVINGVEFYNDSKATTPHATLAALRGFEESVLIAGGRNKGLELAVLANAAEHVHSVIALGESASEISAVFAGLRPVTRAADMHHAVSLAETAAQPSMTVLLSPACASFDMYDSYAARGEDFTRAVLQLSEKSSGAVS